MRHPAVSDSIGSLRTPPGGYPIHRMTPPVGISNTIDRIRNDSGGGQPYRTANGGYWSLDMRARMIIKITGGGPG